MRNKLFSLKRVWGAALLCASAVAHAGIAAYTSQGDFLAAASAPGTDSYDDLSVGVLGLSLVRSAGPYSDTLSSPNGLWGAGGPADDWLSNAMRTDVIAFSNFSTGVNASGGFFFGADVTGHYLPGSDLAPTASDGTALTHKLTGAARTSFLGFVSDSTLSSVSLMSAANETAWPTAHAVVLAVPEPAPYGMFLAGFGILGVMSRRRG